jgi:hypothetical protein
MPALQQHRRCDECGAVLVRREKLGQPKEVARGAPPQDVEAHPVIAVLPAVAVAVKEASTGPTAVVSALGPSLLRFVPLRDRAGVVVGMNDVDRYLAPDHLLLLHGPKDFSDERRGCIENTRAKHVWLYDNGQIPKSWDRLGQAARRTFPIQTVAEGIPNLDTDKLCTFVTTVIPCIHLAYRLGAKRIGVIGCDLRGTHNLAKQADRIDQAIGKMRIALAARKVELANLATKEESAIASLHRCDMEEWLNAV